MPSRTLSSTAGSIGSAALGENTLGDITYRVIIVPQKHDPRLRWNMTASVNIEGSDGAEDDS